MGILTIILIYSGLGALFLFVLFHWRKAKKPVVIRVGDPVLVRLDHDVDLWTPGTVASFVLTKNKLGYDVGIYQVTLSDGVNWKIYGENIKPDQKAKKLEQSTQPSTYR